MMRINAHMRVAYDSVRDKTHVDCTVAPNNRPITKNGEYFPTLCFTVVLNIPEEMFDQASKVIAELTVPIDQARIAAEVEMKP